MLPVERVLLPLSDQLHLDSEDCVTVWNVLREEGGGCGGGREGGRESVFMLGQSGLEGL